MRNFRELPIPAQATHGYPCAHVPTGGSFLNPQTPRRSLTPPPLSAPNRSSKNIAEPAQLWSLRVRADAAFPGNIGAKGSRREESRIFPKHRNAAEVHAELSGTARSGTGYPRLSLRACSNRRRFFEPADFASPLDAAAVIRAEPQFQEHRRTCTVAEPPRLSLPQICSRRIAEPHTYGRGRLRGEAADSRYRKNRTGAVFAVPPNYG